MKTVKPLLTPLFGLLVCVTCAAQTPPGPQAGPPTGQTAPAQEVADEHAAAFQRWVEAGLPRGTEENRLRVSVDALAEFRRRIDVLRENFPEAGRIRIYEWQYLTRLRENDPASVMAHLEKLVAGSNAAIAGWARGELATEKLRSEPIELSFTALDGREVDLTKLRGKVVLVDFWATWCGPCVAEIPNILKAYDRYHDKGFEVIGISADKKGDKQKLMDFVAERKLPWPQHFDEDNERNTIAEKYGVMAYPSMFLFDKSGRLVTTNARGEKLEPEVSRLLGM